MKTSLRLLIALLLVAAAVPLVALHRSHAQSQAQTNGPSEKFHRVGKPVRDQYIVVLKPDTPGEEVEAVTNDLLAKHGGTTGYIYTHAIKGFSIQMPEAAAMALSRDPRVEYVEEDGQFTLATTQLNADWGLDRIDQHAGLNGDYKFANANSGTGVNAYIIDTGLQFLHTDFRGPTGSSRAVNDMDFVGDGQNGFDCNGHGTFVAGVLGGTSFGVAKGVTLHSVRIGGCGNWVYGSTVVAGVDWVTAHHVKPAVANLSLGGDPDSIFGGINYGVEDSVRGLLAAGVTVVAAAGNDNRDAKDTSPARMPEVITVGATGPSDARSSFSNFGPAVDLFAPGEFILSASNIDNNGNGRFDDPRSASGTSFSAPFVAGVAARFLQANPNASPAAVQGAIRNSATPNVVADRGQGSPNLLLYSEIHVALAREASIPAINESDTQVDSGVNVGPGEWLSLTAGGEIWAGVFFTGNNGPQGWNKIEDGAAYPLPGSRPFSLLGILDAQKFYIGNSNATLDNFTSSQRLFLRTNDDVPGNGNGAFNCQAQVWRRLPDVSANLISQSVPSIMLPGQPYTVSITMQNVGPTTWTAGQGYRIGPQPDNNAWGITRFAVPNDVAPGATVTLTFNITAPATPGNYRFQWRMLQEGVQWFGDMTDVPVTVLAPSNQAEFVSQSVTRVMYASEFYTASVTMRNTGNTTWAANSVYGLGSQNLQDNLIWGLNRVRLASPVPPGGTVTFTFTVTAPVKSGTYNFQWRMVQDGVEWFGPATPNVSISVRTPCNTC